MDLLGLGSGEVHGIRRTTLEVGRANPFAQFSCLGSPDPRTVQNTDGRGHHPTGGLPTRSLNTIKGHTANQLAALKWAVRIGFLPAVPNGEAQRRA